MKLEYSEAKLQDLKSNMTILGKEAASAMASVEDQQQNQTLQRLITLVTNTYKMVLGYITSELFLFLHNHFTLFKRLKQSVAITKRCLRSLNGYKERYK